MPREVPQTQVTLTEEIVSYTVHTNGCIEITTACGERVPEETISPDPDDITKDYIVASHFKVDRTRRTTDVTIDGDDYEALLSDSPSWHPEKKGNMFEKNDLWHVIDAKENNTPLEHGSPRGNEHSPPAKPVK